MRNRVIVSLVSVTDNTLLLQPFCTKAQFLSGKAKVDLIEKVAGVSVVIFLCWNAVVTAVGPISTRSVASRSPHPDLVTALYPRKPQMVEQRALPLLWHLLGTSAHGGTVHGRGGSVRGATANLCQALHAQMGRGLAECAASQSADVHKGLGDLLRTLSHP